MKKYSILAILLIVAGIVAFYVVPNRKNDVKLQLRTYSYGKLNTTNSAYITIKEDNVFQFNYSLLSSYIAVGKYTVQGKEVYCKTNDGKFEYVFNINNESLVFDKKKSSKLPEHSKIDEGAVFK